MDESSVVVHPPTAAGGRRVWLDGRPLGVARSLRALTRLLNEAGWEGADEVDVAESPVIEWHGGGPETWSAWGDPWTAHPPRRAGLT
ncbi:hypothetical protein ACGFS9_23165 [Streptomyces sp. NPDC048566]|uniref:hypothetical protein n=1 Tax=Streptomyces sp. NPDC048566 TaxID=3365569 RepID=UPI00371B1B8E